MKLRASTYHDMFNGRTTASGEVYRHRGWSVALTSDHRRFMPGLKLGQILQFKSPDGRRVVNVKVTDTGRGAKHDPSRIFDLSRAAYVYLAVPDAQPGDDPGLLVNRRDWNRGILNLDPPRIMPAGTPRGPQEVQRVISVAGPASETRTDMPPDESGLVVAISAGIVMATFCGLAALRG